MPDFPLSPSAFSNERFAFRLGSHRDHRLLVEEGRLPRPDHPGHPRVDQTHPIPIVRDPHDFRWVSRVRLPPRPGDKRRMLTQQIFKLHRWIRSEHFQSVRIRSEQGRGPRLQWQRNERQMDKFNDNCNNTGNYNCSHFYFIIFISHYSNYFRLLIYK